MQAGFVQRPTHSNTPFDSAMFEVCGHRYADLSEADYGVALLNDCKYGYSCRGSTLCLSLLRSPKSPDPNCDMGHSSFKYGIYAHPGGSVHAGQVVKTCHLFNSPVVRLRKTAGGGFKSNVSEIALTNGLVSIVELDVGLTIDAVKFSEDGLGYILRLVEAGGIRGRATIEAAFCVQNAQQVNMNESLGERLLRDANLSVLSKNRFQVNYESFRIITVYLPFN